MKPEIVSLAFKDQQIRMEVRENGPWWAATDVCKALDLDNNRQALSRLDEDEKGVMIVDTLGGSQEVSAVNEAGLYKLTFSSRKAGAKEFKRWVTHEVLPSIRKTGSYALPGIALPQVPTVPHEVIAELVRELAPYVSGQPWDFRLKNLAEVYECLPEDWRKQLHSYSHWLLNEYRRTRNPANPNLPARVR